MLVDIEKIKVGDRIRKDMGNLKELSEDIAKNGLINPPVVTPTYELIAGERRLQAMKELGYKQVEVRVMTVESAEHKLNLEINENENRKDFNKSERIEYARQLERIERVKAKERQGNRNDLNITQNFGGSETDDIVAKKLDIGSGEQYRKEKYIADNADPETLDQWNKEEISTHKAYQKIKALEEELKDKDEKLKFADFNLRELKNAAIESDEENEKLRAELEYAKNYKPEPEIIEKEVVPEDYEDLKVSISNLYREREELKNQLLIEKDKKKEALKRLEAEEQNREIIREIKGFAWTINAFIKDVGGLLYLIDFLEQVPDTSQKLFISSAETLKQWSEQLDFNIKNRKGLKND